MSKPKWVTASAGWNPQSPNPFSPEGAYGPAWSALTLMPDSDERLHYPGRCKTDRGLFHCLIGTQNEQFDAGVADFLRYESAHGRTVIVSSPEDVDIDHLILRALDETPTESVVRAQDPRWVVHSTTRERWPRIQQCGELRSMARLHSEGTPWPEIGFEQLGEPPEYREYIVLGEMESVGCENVVASHQKGCVFTDENQPYTPGLRLYFDLHRIIADGLAVRDGLHLVKVHDHLPLEPYLAAAVSVGEVDPEGSIPEWTPRRFLEAANAHFLAKYGIAPF